MCIKPVAGLIRQRGLTMVELIIFIVIASIATAGVMQVIVITTANSADPQLRKQALAIAEAIMEEVQVMPFTDCEPDAFDVITQACGRPEAMGADAAGAGQSTVETRGDLNTPFDNVNDYNSFELAGGGSDISGLVTVPAGYTARVAIAQDAGFGPTPLPAVDVLRITVTVTDAQNNNVVLEGYRTKYDRTGMP